MKWMLAEIASPYLDSRKQCMCMQPYIISLVKGSLICTKLMRSCPLQIGQLHNWSCLTEIGMSYFFYIGCVCFYFFQRICLECQLVMCATCVNVLAPPPPSAQKEKPLKGNRRIPTGFCDSCMIMLAPDPTDQQLTKLKVLSLQQWHVCMLFNSENFVWI